MKEARLGMMKEEREWEDEKRERRGCRKKREEGLMKEEREENDQRRER